MEYFLVFSFPNMGGITVSGNTLKPSRLRLHTIPEGLGSAARRLFIFKNARLKTEIIYHAAIITVN